MQRQTDGEAPTNVPGQALPLTDTTVESANAANVSAGAPAANEGTKEQKPRAPRQPRQRGPPEDGIPSKTKIMVANLPYDYSEDKVRHVSSCSHVTQPSANSLPGLSPLNTFFSCFPQHATLTFTLSS